MDLNSLLGDEADDLLRHESKGIPKDDLTLPGPDFVSRVLTYSDRPPQVPARPARSWTTAAWPGRLRVDPPGRPGHRASAAASFAPNPKYFDPANIIELAIEGGFNAVASTIGVLGLMSRRYAHRIPFIVKLNHNELLTYPNRFDQFMFGSVQEAYDMGAAAVGATVYFGSKSHPARSKRSPRPSRRPTSWACSPCGALPAQRRLQEGRHRLRRVRRSHRPGQPHGGHHRGRHRQAEAAGEQRGYNAIGFGKTSDLVYDELTTDNPIDLTRWQVANCYMGRIGLINSGGASSGADDLVQAVRTAVINKRAGGCGLISGRKAFQRPTHEGIELLNAIQDVYLDDSVTIA